MKKRDFISLICQEKNTLFLKILGKYLQFPNRTLLAFIRKKGMNCISPGGDDSSFSNKSTD